jgi:hypothetical protein
VATYELTNYSTGAEYTAYSTLCQIAVEIVSRHTGALRGRMQVLISALKGLLTCLFAIHQNSKPPKGLIPPTWIDLNWPFHGRKMANAYSRLLQTWTTPTMGTLGGQHSQGYLVDQRRLARERVATFVPEILAHFCRMHLVGSLYSDVREELLPAMWECIAMVPMEGLRVMNATLGRDERAIWKSLWVEWRRATNQPLGDDVW